jgi:hypothetical protein
VIGVALVVLASLGAGGVAHALWSAGAPVTGAVTSGTVAVGISGFDDLDHIYTSRSASVGPELVTFTNKGTLPLTGFDVDVTLTGTSSLAGNVTLRVWDNGQSTRCSSTPGRGVDSWTGKLNATISWPDPDSTLAATSTAHENYCVTLTMSPIVTGKAVLATFTVTGMDRSWASASSPSADVTVSTGGTVPTPTPTPTSTPTPTPTPTPTAPASPAGNITMPEAGMTAGSGTSVAVNADLNSNDLIANPDYVCLDLTITGAGNWSVSIDATTQPWNGIPAYSWVWPNGHDGVTVKQNGDIVTLSGSKANALDVPVCVNEGSQAPEVLGPGPNTYTVSTPKAVSCNNTSTAPTQSWDVCLLTTVTGYYPHFAIGYSVSVDFSTISTSGLNSTVANVIRNDETRLQQSDINWYSVTPGANVGNVTRTKDKNSIFTMTSSGLHLDNGGIAKGQTVTLLWQVGQ